MKGALLAVTLLVGAVLGDDAPYPPSGWKPQGALLVLPKYGPPEENSTTTPQPTQDDSDLGKVNESVMERLRQEQGSERGVYYVYLPDGRLQRVQYTSAPLKKAPQSNYQSTQQTQQSNHQVVFGAHQTNTQGNSQSFNKYQSGETNQYQNFAPFQTQNANQYQGQYNQYQDQQYQAQSTANNQYQAQTFAQFQAAQFGQYNDASFAGYPESSGANSNNNNNNNNNNNSNDKEGEPAGDPSQLLARYVKPQPVAQVKSANLQQEELPPSSYVASVQFTDVAPITGPVYSYNPSPLVRVVRYAAKYH